MWKKLFLSTGFIPDLLKTIAIIIARIYFNRFISQWGDTLKLIINLITIGIPLYYAFEWFKAFLLYKRRQDEQKEYVRNLVNNLMSTMAQSSDNQNYPEEQEPARQETPKPPPATYPALLTPGQIEQLNSMRSRISISDVQGFPKIRVSGKDMSNVVPGAGIFSVKINRGGELVNIVVILPTITAIQDFERRCYSFGTLPKPFWAEGHLLPSRTGISCSVLMVTAFRLCGESIAF